MEKFVKFSTLHHGNPGKIFPIIFFYLIILSLNFNRVTSTPDLDEDQRDKNLESYFINQILSQNPVQNSEIPTIKSLLLDMQKSIAALVAREYQRTAQMEELRDALNEFKKFKALVNPNGQNAIYQPPPPSPPQSPSPPPPPVASQPTKSVQEVSTSKEILEEDSTDTIVTSEDEEVETETITAPPTSPTTTTIYVPVVNNFGAEERRENLNQRTIGTGGGGGGAALDGRVESLETEVRSTRNATYQFFQTYCQVTLDSLGVDTSDKNLKIVYSFCHQFQNVPAKPFLGEVISRPRARVYNGPNFTGDFEDFNIEGSLRPKCTSLTSKLAGKIRSIDTFGSCVRLYTDRYSCDGKSMAFYPRISGPDSQQKEEKEQEILGRASSIGPCYDNELDHSYIELASSSTGSNGGQQQQGHIKRFRKLTTLYKGFQIVPDFLVQIGRPTDFKPTYGYPVTQYKTGQNGRIDFISAHITQSDIRRGKRESSVVSEEAKTAFQNGYIYSEKMEGDLMGFYIGARLGPQKSLAFQNVFPQTAENQKMMLEQEQKIVNLPWSNDFHVSVQISVNYESDNGTRPIGFLYWTSHGRDQWSAIYMSNLHA